MAGFQCIIFQLLGPTKGLYFTIRQKGVQLMLVVTAILGPCHPVGTSIGTIVALVMISQGQQNTLHADQVTFASRDTGHG